MGLQQRCRRLLAHLNEESPNENKSHLPGSAVGANAERQGVSIWPYWLACKILYKDVVKDPRV